MQLRTKKKGQRSVDINFREIGSTHNENKSITVTVSFMQGGWMEIITTETTDTEWSAEAKKQTRYLNRIKVRI